MKSTKEYLNEVKRVTGAETDYALAVVLKTSKQNICNYLTKNRPMSNIIALRVADILGIDPYLVIFAVHLERSKTLPEKMLWADILKTKEKQQKKSNATASKCIACNY